MARALVTGATGFVGSWITRTLLDAGHTVRVMHRESSKLDAIEGLDVERVMATLDDPVALAAAVKGIDWVFHVAAVADYWRSGKSKIYSVNVDGTRLLLDACLAANVQRFIFTSSAAAIGYREDGKPVDESHVFSIDPNVSPYGHSKYLAEAEVYKAIHRGLDAIILNPGVILGPGDLNLISGTLITEVAAGHMPFWPTSGGICVIDVRDVAVSHLRAAEKGRSGERYILGTVNMSNQALIKLIAQVIGAPEPWLPLPAPVVRLAATAADFARAAKISLPGSVEGNQLRLSTQYLYFNTQKAQAELHDPEIDLTTTIQETYAWYRDNGYL
jgi:dihydroflavonol-4-reductase